MKFVFVALSFFTLHSAFSATANQQREMNAIKDLETATKALAAQDLSCKTNSQCVVIKLGSKACGGPREYFIASKRNFNFTDITLLASHSARNENRYNARYHVISDCMMRMAPGAACVADVCTETPSEAGDE